MATGGAPARGGGTTGAALRRVVHELHVAQADLRVRADEQPAAQPRAAAATAVLAVLAARQRVLQGQVADRDGPGGDRQPTVERLVESLATDRVVCAIDVHHNAGRQAQRIEPAGYCPPP